MLKIKENKSVVIQEYFDKLNTLDDLCVPCNREIFQKYNRYDPYVRHYRLDYDLPHDCYEYGFELELDFNNQTTAGKCCDLIHKAFESHELKLSSDGSLGSMTGLEIQSGVYDLYSMNNLCNDLGLILSKFSESDLKQRKSVGTHISTNLFDIKVDDRRKTLNKMIYFINHNSGYWQFLSRRTQTDYAVYWNMNKSYNSDKNKAAMRDFRHNGGRYRAINIRESDYNYQCDGRIEIRTFWRTLDTNVLMNDIKIIHALKLFCLYTDADVFDKNSTPNDFELFVFNTDLIAEDMKPDFHC